MRGDNPVAGFLVVLLAVFPLLYSCGPAGESGSGTGNGAASDGQVTVSYWRHYAAPEKAALEKLIQRFEAENPGIHIELKTFPFAVFKTKLVATLSTGQGPDIINIHNSWAYSYIESRLIVPVPEDLFAPGELQQQFFPLAGTFSQHGAFYAVPIAGTNLALFYNKAMFREAGLSPPRTWTELDSSARKLARRDARGRLIRAGASLGSGEGQGWNHFVDGVLPQAGVTLLSGNQRQVEWNTPQGVEALTWYTSFRKGEDAPNSVLFPKAEDAFRLGLSAMIVDGAWRIGGLASDAPDLEYGTAPVPASDAGVRATYGTVWGNAVTRRAPAPVAEAAWKFIRFLASYQNMKFWSRCTGELPLRRRVLEDRAFLQAAEPAEGQGECPWTPERVQLLLPFFDQMAYTDASLKKDEAVYKAAILHAIDEVVLKDVPPREALDTAAKKVNPMLRRK